MTSVELVMRLRELGVRIWAEGEQLRFSAPQGALTPQLRAELAERKQELLLLLHGTTSASSFASASLRPVPRDVDLPLSFAQQRLWFLDRLHPGSPAYNIHLALRLEGLLDQPALQQSLEELVRRHEALRTSFPISAGRPVQVIATTVSVKLPVVDLSGIPAGPRQDRVRRLAEEAAARPFDLASGPLLRARLLRLGEQEHVLSLTVHHIVADGWSMGVMFRELSVLYESFSKGERPSLPRVAIQYADFAVWQRQLVQGPALRAEVDYWRRKLAGSPTVLELPTDRPRPAEQTFQGAACPVRIGRPLAERLVALSRQANTTMFATLLAAFQVLLYRYTGRQDLLVGTPVAGRPRAEVEGVVGLFLNTLIVRTRLSPDRSFRSLLATVREGVLEALDHQALPFEQLVAELRPDRSLGHNPLFQAMFTLDETPPSMPKLGPLKVSPIRIARHSTILDLSLILRTTGEGLTGKLEYRTDLFDADTIERMVGHYQTLLEAITADSDRPIADLPLLQQQEWRRLVKEWNTASSNSSEDDCIHRRFEQQAERTPHAVAVVSPQGQLTYQELNGRTNQLARHLIELGVGPEVPVAICLERSLEMVVALLGIMKAGGACVPLEPTHPKDRLGLMLQDAGARIVLTRRSGLGELPPHRAKVVLLDGDQELTRRHSKANLPRRATPDGLAYVLYTSGSTGRPKGVLQTHRAAVNRFAWQTNLCPAGPEEVYCQKASLGFIDAAWEIFRPLLGGASTVVVADEVVQDPAAFVGALADNHITCLLLVPSLLQVLLNDPDLQRRLPQLRVWVSSGEALPGDLARRFAQVMPSSRLLSLYGLTEAGDTIADDVASTAGTPRAASSRSTIGMPIPNARVFVLDNHLQPLPVGVPGELCFGGRGLARGYLGSPWLTAERFLPDPFSDEPGARLHRTGDRARYLPDGSVELLGRVDDCLNLRGFRIEPGEIEATLRLHTAVREAAVATATEEGGGARLVAYVAFSHGQALNGGELRRFLADRLPAYMVPSAFVAVATLPRLPNGKVDRQALPALRHGRPELEATFVAPRNQVERVLAEIWADVLEVEQVGVHDDFFELGGHSLLAAQVIVRTHDALGVELPLRCLFETPTVAGLALHLGARHAVARLTGPPVVRIQPHGGRRPLLCIHPAGGSVLCYKDLARALGPDQPFYAIEAPSLETAAKPYSRLEHMAADYLRALLELQGDGPYMLAGWSLGGVVAFEMARQLQAKGRDIALLTLLDSRAPRPDSNAADFDDAALLNLFLEDLGRLAGTNLRLDDVVASQAPTDQLLDLALERAWKNNALPASIGRPQLRRWLGVFNANMRAVLDYHPPAYPGDLVLIRAGERPGSANQDQTMGWSILAASTEVHTTPGNHYTMMRWPNVQDLARLLRRRLDAAQRPAP